MEKTPNDIKRKLIFNLSISLLCYITLHIIGYFIGDMFITYERSFRMDEDYRRSFESVIFVAIAPLGICYLLGTKLKKFERAGLNFLSISGIFVFAFLAQNLPANLVNQSAMLSVINSLPTIWLEILNIEGAPDRAVIWSIIVAIFPVIVVFCGMYTDAIKEVLHELGKDETNEEEAGEETETETIEENNDY
jgi:hypothetical protein